MSTLEREEKFNYFSIQAALKKSLFVLMLLATIMVVTGCNNGASVSPTTTIKTPIPKATTSTPNNSSAVSTTVSVSKEPTATSDTQSTTFTLATISTHNTKEDCWMAINGNVYNFTEYIASGGHVPQIVDGCGIDATTLFENVRKHSGPQAQNLLKQYFIGTLQ